MTKEQFYDQLNSIIEELTIDYSQQLRGISEDILKKVEENMIDANEVASFIKEQEYLFRERLDSTIVDIVAKVEDMLANQNKVKKGIITKIRSSFAIIYESIVARLSDLF